MSSQRQRAVRAAGLNLAGVTLLLAVLSVSFLATRVRDTAHLVPGMSTAADVPGTCHNHHDYFENDLASAELTPAVPCTSPHTSETLWYTVASGILAAQPNRPTPEMLGGVYKDICHDPARLNTYVGQRSTGFLYNLNVYPRYPSAPEWRAGVRSVRCVASMWYHIGPGRARWSFPLRDSWMHPVSATIRLCANGGVAYVPCDRPHIEEVLQPLNPFPTSQRGFPDARVARRLGQVPCTKAALDLLGLKALPAGLHAVVEPPELANWAHSHDVGCRIGSGSRTGTLQGLT